MNAGGDVLLLLPLACEPDPIEVPGDSGTPATAPSDDTEPVVVSSTPCAECGGDCLIEELSYGVGTAYHTTQPVDYVSRPPAGGPHNGCWSTWGVHAEAVADDYFVHNLEHGGVVYLYACDDCADDVAALDGIAAQKGIFTLVTPYAEMESTFAAVAWGWRLTTGCVDEPLFSGFYDDHVDQAPESIPSDPSSACM